MLAADAKAAGTTRVYIGTYTGGSKSEGIYLLNLDLATGAFHRPPVRPDRAEYAATACRH